MRFIIKKAPIKTKDTKYTHGQEFPKESLAYESRQKQTKMVKQNIKQNVKKKHTKQIKMVMKT